MNREASNFVPVEDYLEMYNDLNTEIKLLKFELNQQRFNNKHNLSIDQKIADEMERLKKEVDELSDMIHHQRQREAALSLENEQLKINRRDSADTNQILFEAKDKEILTLKKLIATARPWVGRFKTYKTFGEIGDRGMSQWLSDTQGIGENER